MIITQQPVPKTIEDLAQEVSEDTRLARLEHQRALQVCSAHAAVVLTAVEAVSTCVLWSILQDEAIRSYKLDTVVVGAPQPTPATSEADSDDTGQLRPGCEAKRRGRLILD